MQQNAMESLEVKESKEQMIATEIRNYLNELEKNKIFYPFNYSKILSLHDIKEAEAGKELIREKKDMLLQMIEAIGQEKEGGLWEGSKSNREIEVVLRELVEENDEILEK